MWFDGEKIAMPHEIKEQRRHDRDNGSAGCLVASNLHLTRVGAHPIGMMDLLRREPEHTLLHAFKK